MIENQTKICFKCNLEKPLFEFYKHKAMSDGFLGKCKLCTKNDTRIREQKLFKNPEWRDKEKKRHRDKYYRLGYKEKHKPTPQEKKVSMDKYENKYPEKKRARNLVSSLKPLIDSNHLHHWSYNLEHAKDIIELEPKHHYIIHRYIIYDQERMMYRTLNGILLDTKERHVEYISEFIKKE